ncbi:MAG: ACT domain-containing protein [Candidatus Aminicenantes bacterium]|nr:ACT domain-containing protein [Candidatus Aminicenantes bacterium]
MQHIKEDEELEVTTPDEPGILGRVLGTLANGGINLRALSVSTRNDQGHFRLLTTNSLKAAKALKTLGFKVQTAKVVVVEVSDRIGAGAEIGALLGNAAVNVRYCYGSTSAGAGKALLVFQTSDNKTAIETLK